MWCRETRKVHVLVADNGSCTDFQRSSPSGQTHETDITDTTTMRRSRGNSENTVSLKSPFDLKKIWHLTVLSM